MPESPKVPSRLWLTPTASWLPSGWEVRPVDGTPLLKVRHNLDIRPGPPEVRVSAHVDDPNRASPVIMRFHADEFEGSSTDGELVGRGIAVKMDARAEDGDWIYSAGAPQLAAMTTYATVRTTLEAAEHLLKMPVRWGDGGRLSVEKYETDSNDLNASFQWPTQGLSIGHAVRQGYSWSTGPDANFRSDNPANNLALVPDVVAHEAGHAVVHALKSPTALTVKTGSTDQASVNEGLADCFAFLTAIRQGSVLQRALRETQLDLSRPNALSEIGDSLGEVFAHAGLSAGGPLRTLIHSKVRERDVTYESHEGGEIIGGAFYDLFLSLLPTGKANPGPRIQALNASESAGTLFLNALKFTPDHGELTFEDFGRGLIFAAMTLLGGKYVGQVRDVVVRRNLLTAEDADQAILQHAHWQQLALRIDPAILKDKEHASALLPELRQVFGLSPDAVLEPGRVERDDFGLTRVVYYQPRANKAAELTSPEVNDAYGIMDRDALLSRGAFTAVFDGKGRVVSAFDRINSGAHVRIDGVRGDGL